ncbi:MAG: hypothetical protein HN413_08025 [Chloroflexi bacterium]|jgi:hypothetical protein|nr:hypothetical protein [Chloroflexota bacterium]
MSIQNAYEILSGVGVLYVATAETAKPSFDSAPGVAWTEISETDGGVKVISSQEIEKLYADQHTGALKAIRKEESLKIETNIIRSTLEILAKILGGVTVTDTAAGASTIGYRTLGFHRGNSVTEFAMLFRGTAQSAYGASYSAQFYIPRGFFNGEMGLEFKKDGKVMVPVQFEALMDLDEATSEYKFGQYDMQDAAPTG